MKRKYGHTLVDGVLQYWSASSLQLGDASSGDGCLRKWVYEKVLGKKAPQTKAQTLGVELHEQNEGYLKTGVNALGSLALRGMHMLPKPGDDLLVEHDLVIHPEVEAIARDAEQEGRLEEAQKIRDQVVLGDAPLRLLGIPVLGFIDLAHTRGTNQGATDFEDALDPPNTGEVLDWKTTKDVKYIKSAREVSRTVQMTLYEKWLLTVVPRLEHVRASHGYYITQGSHAPRKVSLRITREQVEKQWEHVERVGRSILDVIPEQDVDKVPANRNACGAYGGCPHRSYCTAGQQNGLAKYFGTAGAARLQAQAQGKTIMTTTEKKGGLLAFGKNKKAEAQVQAPAPTEQELEAEMLRLAREEAAAKYPTLLAEWTEFVAFGLGAPKLSGIFAQAVFDLTGESFVVGHGDFAESGPFEDPEMMGALLADIKAYVKEKAGAAEDTRPLPQVVPEDTDQGAQESATPVASPAIPATPSVAETPAAPPVAGKKRGRPRKVQPVEGAPLVAKIVSVDGVAVTPVDAVSPDPYLAGILAGVDAESVVAVADDTLHFEKVEEILGSGSTGVLLDPYLEGIMNRPDPLNSLLGKSLQEIKAEFSSSMLFFYVDALPSCPSTSFWPTVNTVLSDMAKEAKLPDVRLADGKHELAFGKWRYALSLCIQMNVPSSGHWTFDTTNSEVSSVIVEALREAVLRAGGVFVRGTR